MVDGGICGASDLLQSFLFLRRELLHKLIPFVFFGLWITETIFRLMSPISAQHLIEVTISLIFISRYRRGILSLSSVTSAPALGLVRYVLIVMRFVFGLIVFIFDRRCSRFRVSAISFVGTSRFDRIRRAFLRFLELKITFGCRRGSAPVVQCNSDGYICLAECFEFVLE